LHVRENGESLLAKLEGHECPSSDLRFDGETEIVTCRCEAEIAKRIFG
jgi:hypothetical protein